MLDYKTIGEGPLELARSFDAQTKRLISSLNLNHMDGFVLAFSGDSDDMGRFEPGAFGMVAGGALDRLKFIAEGLLQIIAEAEAVQQTERRDPEPEPERCEAYPHCACGAYEAARGF